MLPTLKINDEVKQTLGSVDIQIIESEKQPIRTVDKQTIGKMLPNVIMHVAKDVGILDVDKYSLIRTVDIIGRYYSALSLTEIKLAFELLMVGELDQHLPQSYGQPDKNHYNKFTPEYVTKVLNAYKRRKNKAIIKLVNNQPKQEALPKPKKLVFSDFLNELLVRYNAFTLGKYIPYMRPYPVLAFFKHIGISKSIPEYNKKLLEKEYQLQLGSDKKTHEKQKLKIGDEYSLIIHISAENQFYNEKIEELFNYIKKKEINLKKIIDEIKRTSSAIDQ